MMIAIGVGVAAPPSLKSGRNCGTTTVKSTTSVSSDITSTNIG
jgi:hypothetical protein